MRGLLLLVAATCALMAQGDGTCESIPLAGAAVRAGCPLPRPLEPVAGVLSLRGGQGVGDAAGGGVEADEVDKAMQLLSKAEQGFAAAGKGGFAREEGGIEGLREALLDGGLEGEDLEQAMSKANRAAKQRLRVKEGGFVDDDDDDDSWEEEWEKEKAASKQRETEMLRNIQRPGERPWGEGAGKAAAAAWPELQKEAMSLKRDRHYPLWKAVNDANIDRLRYLLGRQGTDGAFDASHKFKALWNSTLLHIAAEQGDVEVATAVAQHDGCDINAHNTFRQTPLHLACYWGRTGLVERLLDMGAEMEGRGDDDSTSLHIAAFQGKNETAKALVELGASLTSTNNKNQNAIALAEMGGWLELGGWLRERAGLRVMGEEEKAERKQKFEEIKAEYAERIMKDYTTKLTKGKGDLSEDVRAKVWEMALETAEVEAKAKVSVADDTARVA